MNIKGIEMQANIIQKNIFSYLPVIILISLILSYLYVTSPDVVGGDTSEYMNLYTWRPPLYPLFFWSFNWIGQYQATVVMWVQSFACLFALLYARHWLHQRLGLSEVITFFIMIGIILQVFFHYHMLQMIYSEGIAFPLFVFSFLLLVDCIYQFELKKIILLICLVHLLVLTRLQFYLFYLLLGGLIIWHALKKVPASKLALIALLIVFSVVMGKLIEKKFHQLFPVTATSYGSPNLYFLIHTMYVSSMKDVQYLKNNEEKKYFSEVIQEMENKQLTKQSAPLMLGRPMALPMENTHYAAAHYQMLRIAYPPLKKLSYEKSEALIWNINKTLFKQHFKESLVFYFWRVISTIGDVSVFFIIFIAAIAAIYRIVTDQKWKPTYTQIFIAVACFTILLNIFAINIFEISEIRYLYYGFFLTYCLGGVLADKLFLSRYIYLSDTSDIKKGN